MDLVVHGQGLFCKTEEKPPPSSGLRHQVNPSEPATPQGLKPGSRSENNANDAEGPSSPLQSWPSAPLWGGWSQVKRLLCARSSSWASGGSARG